jgi:hypothetical protein
MVIGGVNTYHLRATRRGFWGLVVFPRFASVRRTAAADIGGGGALSIVFFLQSHRLTVQKQTPKVQTFLKSPELKLQLQLCKNNFTYIRFYSRWNHPCKYLYMIYSVL